MSKDDVKAKASNCLVESNAELSLDCMLKQVAVVTLCHPGLTLAGF
jgi:hypothetical protein